MRKPDYYERLGVPRNADEKIIRQAYRSLARKYHPDLNPGDKEAEEKFKQISEAYSVLSDPEKRRQYDMLGDQGQPGGFAGWPGGFEGAAGGTPFDFLNDLFGGAGGFPFGETIAAGEDVEAAVEISLEDAYRGGERSLTIATEERCPTCSGTGAQPGSQMVECPQCHGSGRAHNRGGFTLRGQLCPRCQGTGQVPSRPCATCLGRGVTQRPRVLTVTIPAGIKDGQLLKLSGQGRPGPRGAPAGDLLLRVHIRPHPIFERRGDDLIIDLPVTYAEAVLGAEVRVPTLSGRVVRTQVRPGMHSGQLLKLPGLGMPRPHGGYGDLYARLQIVVPRTLSDRERQLIEELRSLRTEDPREKLLAGR
ncbi:MAG: J domain-containing protein [Armatimonadetes bacterium]|nr:J domain-containing protein [Armatimonadota bacterium]